MEDIEQYQAGLSKEEINLLPLRHYQGRIHLVRSKRQLDFALERLRGESVLGFDTESKPAFKRGESYPPSLVQLAGVDAVFLFHFGWLPFPDELKSLLADPEVVKCGVAVRDDIKALQEVSFFEDSGFLDLGEVVRGHGCRNSGLRTMAANFLNFRISKRARRSNWSRLNLTRTQIVYAATDAWLSRELYLWLKARDWL